VSNLNQEISQITNPDNRFSQTYYFQKLINQNLTWRTKALKHRQKKLLEATRCMRRLLRQCKPKLWCQGVGFQSSKSASHVSCDWHLPQGSEHEEEEGCKAESQLNCHNNCTRSQPKVASSKMLSGKISPWKGIFPILNFWAIIKLNYKVRLGHIFIFWLVGFVFSAGDETQDLCMQHKGSTTPPPSIFIVCKAWNTLSRSCYFIHFIL
jgi:hypothetical protein